YTRLTRPPQLSVPISLSTATTPPEISTLSLHDALPICAGVHETAPAGRIRLRQDVTAQQGLHGIRVPLERHVKELHAGLHPDLRSEEHTSELQSRFDLVCRLLLEKKKMQNHELRDRIR